MTTEIQKHAEADEALEELRSALTRAQRDLAKSKRSKADYIEAVYRAVRDGIMTLRIPPVKAPSKDARRGSPEVAVAMFGDLQLGKVTATYNSQVCEERIALYAQKILDLTAIQRTHHPVRELRVWMLGDIVEGVNIFPGQSWLVDSGLYRQMTVDGPRILTGFLRTMLANFEKVHVCFVIGNHGRMSSVKGEHDPESNADRVVGRIVQQLMAGEKRLTWNLPDGRGERNWYAVDTIGNYSCLLFHGDQIRGGFGGFPFYGLAKKVWGWKSGAIRDHFDDVAFGHFHTPTTVTLNTTTARCNGTPESDNTYAQESLAAMGRPAQRLMYVHPVRGRVTAEYLVHLDGK